MIVDNRELTLRVQTVLRSFTITINASTIKEDRAIFCLLQPSAIVNSIGESIVKSVWINTSENLSHGTLYPLGLISLCLWNTRTLLN